MSASGTNYWVFSNGFRWSTCCSHICALPVCISYETEPVCNIILPGTETKDQVTYSSPLYYPLTNFPASLMRVCIMIPSDGISEQLASPEHSCQHYASEVQNMYRDSDAEKRVAGVSPVVACGVLNKLVRRWCRGMRLVWLAFKACLRIGQTYKLGH